jgi:acetyl-CoA acetyltransferase
MTQRVALVPGALIGLNDGLRMEVGTAQQVELGAADGTIGAGVESKTRSGYLMPHARWGARMGHTKSLDIAVIEATEVFATHCERVLHPQGPPRPEC